jgi:hypothetical protein
MAHRKPRSEFRTSASPATSATCIAEREPLPALEIHLDYLESIVFPDVIEARDVSIDGDDVVPLVQEPAGVATRSARDVEHRTGGRDQ